MERKSLAKLITSFVFWLILCAVIVLREFEILEKSNIVIFSSIVLLIFGFSFEISAFLSSDKIKNEEARIRLMAFTIANFLVGATTLAGIALVLFS